MIKLKCFVIYIHCCIVRVYWTNHASSCIITWKSDVIVVH
jgi:hypothetical protein